MNREKGTAERRRQGDAFFHFGHDFHSFFWDRVLVTIAFPGCSLVESSLSLYYGTNPPLCAVCYRARRRPDQGQRTDSVARSSKGALGKLSIRKVVCCKAPFRSSCCCREHPLFRRHFHFIGRQPPHNRTTAQPLQPSECANPFTLLAWCRWRVGPPRPTAPDDQRAPRNASCMHHRLSIIDHPTSILFQHTAGHYLSRCRHGTAAGQTDLAFAQWATCVAAAIQEPG